MGEEHPTEEIELGEPFAHGNGEAMAPAAKAVGVCLQEGEKGMKNMEWVTHDRLEEGPVSA